MGRIKQENLRPTEIDRDRRGDLKSGVPQGGVRVRVPPPALGKGSSGGLFSLNGVVSRDVRTARVAARVAANRARRASPRRATWRSPTSVDRPGRRQADWRSPAGGAGIAEWSAG